MQYICVMLHVSVKCHCMASANRKLKAKRIQLLFVKCYCHICDKYTIIDHMNLIGMYITVTSLISQRM